MGNEVEGGRQVEGGGNWEISVTSPTRLEVDPQLAQAARLTPRPESKDLLLNVFHTISADLRILKVHTHYTSMRCFFQLFASFKPICCKYFKFVKSFWPPLYLLRIIFPKFDPLTETGVALCLILVPECRQKLFSLY
jgi:hypothetical protein